MSIHRMFGFGLAIALIVGVFTANAVAQGYQQGTIDWLSSVIQADPASGSQKPPVITGVNLQPQGSMIALVGDDHVVNLYDRQTQTFSQPLIEHTDWV